ncbi:NepR family anti-sigma factor [Chachezhania sediminis]|uniref:NepR family anti-sigma factor n=1 Tax=Chachezhania sediminis TaxID=2599291 RepID=UPI001E2EC30E|nr:NepR family anti-sigma factor [Chachezhania sediminis]
MQIDESLRRVFEEDIEEALPPRLMDLLDQLNKIEAPQPSPGASRLAGGNGESAQ